jgi:3-oxoacyl-[acyl-carrier-protein] synthase II
MLISIPAASSAEITQQRARAARNAEMSTRRVAITGVAVISAAGGDKEEFWNAVNTANSHVKKLSRFSPHRNGTTPCEVAAEISQFAINQFTRSKIKKYMDRAGAYAVAAAIDCLKDAHFGPDNSSYESLEIYLGSCCGAQEWVEKEFSRVGDVKIESLHPHTSVLAHPGNVIGLVTIILGIRGRGILLSNLDLAGMDALDCAVRRIQSNLSQRILVGAADAPITPLLFGVFEEAGLLSHCNDDPARASRPFDRNRDGLVLGEGAVMLMVEDYEEALRRKARIYAEVLSCASTFEYRMNGDMPFASQVAQGRQSISLALKKAGIQPEMIDYIHADGSSLPELDKVEAGILQEAFGSAISSIPVSSTKAVTGHALSVSGLFQSAACALLYERNTYPPLGNFEHPDPDCALNFVLGPSQACSPNLVLQHTHSVLQHHNTAVVFKKPSEAIQ